MRIEQEKTKVTKVTEVCGIHYSFTHLPAHPKCRVFSMRMIESYAERLRSAGNVMALTQLAVGLQTMAQQPPQITRYEFKSGRVGHTYIIHLRALRGQTVFDLLKLGLCGCGSCLKQRRAN